MSRRVGWAAGAMALGVLGGGAGCGSDIGVSTEEVSVPREAGGSVGVDEGGAPADASAVAPDASDASDDAG